jgi:hypothetical protein
VPWLASIAHPTYRLICCGLLACVQQRAQVSATIVDACVGGGGGEPSPVGEANSSDPRS